MFYFILIFFGIVILFNVINAAERKRREKARAESIYAKYGYTDVAEKIIARKIWVGATSDQLMDSWGKPVDIDENILKTKRKEVWKYFQKKANLYGYKVKVENGIVVGWDEKM